MNASEKKYAITRLNNMADSAEERLKASFVMPDPKSCTVAEIRNSLKRGLLAAIDAADPEDDDKPVATYHHAASRYGPSYYSARELRLTDFFQLDGLWETKEAFEDRLKAAEAERSAAVEALRAEVQRITDEFMLGEGSEALAMLKSFEESHRP